MNPGDNKEVSIELYPLIKVYKDGTVERLAGSPYVPPSPSPDPTTGVSSKDITISPHISARLYLPSTTATTTPKKLPILIYYHGGGFCVESAFSSFDHRYLRAIVSKSKSLAISIEYRLAPENPLPIAYEDSWVALNWVASQLFDELPQRESWLTNYGDVNRVFLGGDSAGANIVHNILIRAGAETVPGGLKILGSFLSQPYFWGSDRIGSETSNSNIIKDLIPKIWMFVYPMAPGGIDNPMINPFVGDAPSLAGLGCSRLLVCVAEKDELRERGVWYCEEVRRSGWEGQVEMFEVEGEDHAFHIFNIESENAKKMVDRLASFISSQ